MESTENRSRELKALRTGLHGVLKNLKASMKAMQTVSMTTERLANSFSELAVLDDQRGTLAKAFSEFIKDVRNITDSTAFLQYNKAVHDEVQARIDFINEELEITESSQKATKGAYAKLKQRREVVEKEMVKASKKGLLPAGVNPSLPYSGSSNGITDSSGNPSDINTVNSLGFSLDPHNRGAIGKHLSRQWNRLLGRNDNQPLMASDDSGEEAPASLFQYQSSNTSGLHGTREDLLGLDELNLDIGVDSPLFPYKTAVAKAEVSRKEYEHTRRAYDNQYEVLRETNSAASRDALKYYIDETVIFLSNFFKVLDRSSNRLFNKYTKTKRTSPNSENAVQPPQYGVEGGSALNREELLRKYGFASGGNRTGAEQTIGDEFTGTDGIANINSSNINAQGTQQQRDPQGYGTTTTAPSNSQWQQQQLSLGRGGGPFPYPPGPTGWGASPITASPSQAFPTQHNPQQRGYDHDAYGGFGVPNSSSLGFDDASKLMEETNPLVANSMYDMNYEGHDSRGSREDDASSFSMTNDGDKITISTGLQGSDSFSTASARSSSSSTSSSSSGDENGEYNDSKNNSRDGGGAGGSGSHGNHDSGSNFDGGSNYDSLHDGAASDADYGDLEQFNMMESQGEGAGDTDNSKSQDGTSQSSSQQGMNGRTSSAIPWSGNYSSQGSLSLSPVPNTTSLVPTTKVRHGSEIATFAPQDAFDLEGMDVDLDDPSESERTRLPQSRPPQVNLTQNGHLRTPFHFDEVRKPHQQQQQQSNRPLSSNGILGRGSRDGSGDVHSPARQFPSRGGFGSQRLLRRGNSLSRGMGASGSGVGLRRRTSVHIIDSDANNEDDEDGVTVDVHVASPTALVGEPVAGIVVSTMPSREGSLRVRSGSRFSQGSRHGSRRQRSSSARSLVNSSFGNFDGRDRFSSSVGGMWEAGVDVDESMEDEYDMVPGRRASGFGTLVNEENSRTLSNASPRTPYGSSYYVPRRDSRVRVHGEEAVEEEEGGAPTTAAAVGVALTDPRVTVPLAVRTNDTPQLQSMPVMATVVGESAAVPGMLVVAPTSTSAAASSSSSSSPPPPPPQFSPRAPPPQLATEPKSPTFVSPNGQNLSREEAAAAGLFPIVSKPLWVIANSSSPSPPPQSTKGSMQRKAASYPFLPVTVPLSPPQLNLDTNGSSSRGDDASNHTGTQALAPLNHFLQTREAAQTNLSTADKRSELQPTLATTSGTPKAPTSPKYENGKTTLTIRPGMPVQLSAQTPDAIASSNENGNNLRGTGVSTTAPNKIGTPMSPVVGAVLHTGASHDTASILTGNPSGIIMATVASTSGYSGGWSSGGGNPSVDAAKKKNTTANTNTSTRVVPDPTPRYQYTPSTYSGAGYYAPRPLAGPANGVVLGNNPNNMNGGARTGAASPSTSYAPSVAPGGATSTKDAITTASLNEEDNATTEIPGTDSSSTSSHHGNAEGNQAGKVPFTRNELLPDFELISPEVSTTYRS